METTATTADRALALKSLHEAPEILRVVNVWDAVSAQVVADLPGTKAIATAGHSIAKMFGYDDGGMPLDTALAGIKTVVDAVALPVTADLDDGYAEPGETIRRAIGIGVVGANVEDRLRPFDESVARVRSIVQAAEQEGVAFQLNARTDAIARGGERGIDESIEDAIARGTAFLEEGASLVFVPGAIHREHVERIVAGLGRGKLSVIGLPVPGVLTAAEYQELGVARISYGPLPQRVALLALQQLATDLYGDGVIPVGMPPLN
jgi:2-methylisocitrate lyase-like PEP mutase family enzyme